MESLINFILNGSNELNAASLVGFMAFCIIVDAISSIAASALSVGGNYK